MSEARQRCRRDTTSHYYFLHYEPTKINYFVVKLRQHPGHRGQYVMVSDGGHAVGVILAEASELFKIRVHFSLERFHTVARHIALPMVFWSLLTTANLLVVDDHVNVYFWFFSRSRSSQSWCQELSLLLMSSHGNVECPSRVTWGEGLVGLYLISWVRGASEGCLWAWSFSVDTSCGDADRLCNTRARSLSHRSVIIDFCCSQKVQFVKQVTRHDRRPDPGVDDDYGAPRSYPKGRYQREISVSLPSPSRTYLRFWRAKFTTIRSLSLKDPMLGAVEFVQCWYTSATSGLWIPSSLNAPSPLMLLRIFLQTEFYFFSIEKIYYGSGQIKQW